jgi:hypothetical protein
MTPLSVLTSLLLVLSGGFKLRAGARAGVGLHLLSLLELLAGAGLMMRVMGGGMTAEQGLGSAVGAVALIVVSSVHLGRRLGHKRRLRELTEGRRLENFVNAPSRFPEDPGLG